jgi:hypothetical protein
MEKGFLRASPQTPLFKQWWKGILEGLPFKLPFSSAGGKGILEGFPSNSPFQAVLERDS